MERAQSKTPRSCESAGQVQGRLSSWQCQWGTGFCSLVNLKFFLFILKRWIRPTCFYWYDKYLASVLPGNFLCCMTSFFVGDLFTHALFSGISFYILGRFTFFVIISFVLKFLYNTLFSYSLPLSLSLLPLPLVSLLCYGLKVTYYEQYYLKLSNKSSFIPPFPSPFISYLR